VATTAGAPTASTAARSKRHPESAPPNPPQIRKHFPSFPDRPPKDLHAAINTIKEPSLIRVEADEAGGARARASSFSGA
jgi:hypothetical protein